MKRSRSENDTKDMIHNNIDIYRSRSENIREINQLVTELRLIDVEIQEITKQMSEEYDNDLQSELVTFLLERDIIKEIIECENTKLEYNTSIL